MSLKGLKSKADAALANIPESSNGGDKRSMRPTTSPGATALMQPTIDALNERAKTAEAQVAEYQRKLAQAVTELPLDALLMMDSRKRKLTPEQFDELKANLAQNPLVHPISVKALADGRYEVVSGHNRVEAFRALGRVTIPVAVVDLDDVLIERSSFYANLLQPSLPDYEKFLGFKAERDRTGKPQRQMAHEAGVAESMLSGLFQFEHLPAEVLALLDKQPDIMGWSCAAQLAKLSEAGKGAQVVDAAKQLATGTITQSDAVRIAKRTPAALAAKPKPAEAVKIRAGRSEFCRYIGAGASLRIDFKDEGLRTEAEAAINQLLRDLASRHERT